MFEILKQEMLTFRQSMCKSILCKGAREEQPFFLDLTDAEVALFLRARFPPLTKRSSLLLLPLPGTHEEATWARLDDEPEVAPRGAAPEQKGRSGGRGRKLTSGSCALALPFPLALCFCAAAAEALSICCDDDEHSAY